MHPRTIADLILSLPLSEAQNLIYSIHNGDHSDILRRIVRDDIGGAADRIANALWVNS